MAGTRLGCSVLYLVYLLLQHEALVEATGRANTYPGSTASRIAGEFWIKAPGYAPDVTQVVVKKTLSVKLPCDCHMACFAVRWCTSAAYDAPNQSCSLSDSPKVEAVPDPDSVYFYKPDSEVYLSDDGLFYMVLPPTTAVGYDGMKQKCEDQGFQVAQVKTQQSFEILKEMHQKDLMQSHWIGLVPKFGGGYQWEDGTVFDPANFGGEGVAAINAVDVAIFFYSTTTTLYGWDKTNQLGMICQANFLNTPSW